MKLPSTSRIPQRYSSPPLGVPERVALEVEEEVAGRRVGQEREAALRLRLEQDVRVVAVSRAPQSWSEACSRILSKVVRREPRRRPPRARARAQRASRCRRPRACRSAMRRMPGDAREVVDRVPVRVAERAESRRSRSARRARARCAAGRRRTPRAAAERVGSKRRTPRAGTTTRSPEPSTTCICCGSAPLNASDLLGVEAELEDVVRLRVPSELRVDDLVGAVWLKLEKVGAPAPAGGVVERRAGR